MAKNREKALRAKELFYKQLVSPSQAVETRINRRRKWFKKIELRLLYWSVLFQEIADRYASLSEGLRHDIKKKSR